MSENSAPDTARKATAPALLELEHDNLRTAIGSALDARDTLTAARACTSLWRFWEVRGHLSEGRSWLHCVCSRLANCPRRSKGGC